MLPAFLPFYRMEPAQSGEFLLNMLIPKWRSFTIKSMIIFSSPFDTVKNIDRSKIMIAINFLVVHKNYNHPLILRAHSVQQQTSVFSCHRSACFLQNWQLYLPYFPDGSRGKSTSRGSNAVRPSILKTIVFMILIIIIILQVVFVFR